MSIFSNLCCTHSFSIDPAPVKHPEDEVTVCKLIAEYTDCFDDGSLDKINENFSLQRFKARLKQYITSFPPCYNPDTDYGFMQKIDLPLGTKIFVRADLHADLYSLLSNLSCLQDEGYLDENYRCRPGVYLVFLGDYADRGAHSLQLLELLAALKLENPDYVTLIRGNHEYTWMHSLYSGSHDPNFDSFLNKEENIKLLEEFYQTLSLTLYIGAANPEGKRQYVQFTHGAFELYSDPAPLLEDSLSNSSTPIPKFSDEAFNLRITSLLSSYDLKEISENVKDLQLLVYESDEEERLRLYGQISHREEKDLKMLKKVTKEEHTRLKSWIGAKRIYTLWLFSLSYRREEPEYTLYNWGDISNARASYSLGHMMARQWKISPKDVKKYFYMSSTDAAKVKMLIRGHQHAKKHHLLNKKVLITTLPVGMNSNGYDTVFDQQDTAYILSLTDPKVKNWTKQACERFPSSPWPFVSVSESYPIQTTTI